MKKNLIILVLIGCIIFILIQTKTVNFSYLDNLLPEQQNAAGLEKKYNQMQKLAENKEYALIYENYYSPDLITNTQKQKEEYIQKMEKQKKYSVQTHDFIVKDNMGYIDRTVSDCLDDTCDNKQVTRGYKVWKYIKGHWYSTFDVMPCIRDVGYEKPPEFNRAMDLIIQRLSQTGDQNSHNFSNYLNSIKNCINIQYANSDSDMNNAEGYFSLNKNNQNLEEYDITVSPRYSIKDDLITAVLLDHEITHVIDYSDYLMSGNSIPCYELEARAFGNQNWFLVTLNLEEKKSLLTRLTYNPSEELRQIFDVYNTIPKYPGNTYQEKALNFVKSSSYYKEQCGTN
jgi:hypothetical protein